MLFKPVFVPGSTSEVDFFLSEFVGTKHFSLEGSDFFPTSKERNNNWIELRLKPGHLALLATAPTTKL